MMISTCDSNKVSQKQLSTFLLIFLAKVRINYVGKVQKKLTKHCGPSKH